MIKELTCHSQKGCQRKGEPDGGDMPDVYRSSEVPNVLREIKEVDDRGMRAAQHMRSARLVTTRFPTC